ncbi:hypothetical protein NBRC110019_25560 [Neptunitalea chrysea]|uniref:Isoprenylcysteine carboxyl methyltransferase n=1 Tax=Neptunitalea chrysea TaxID=1647581 RepID=A0A9W6B6L2_9FLAO|nr:hypothetical protein NBRC110019_25560 [Neptunitalea chrysea]
MLIGLIIMVSTVYLFRKHKTTLEWKTSRTLLKTGFYKYSRNPIYIGLAFLIFGLSVYSRNVLALPLVGLFLVALRFGVIRIEERMLAATFGKEYLQYMIDVRRWL